jgi:branched-chain amino acid transport system substrate-binding protein
MKSINKKLATGVVLAGGVAFGFSSAAAAADTVNVGLSTSLSGPVASLGVTNKQGIQIALDEINAKGGLLGKKVKLLTADAEIKPATGVTNVRNFILKDQVKAIFGPVASSVGAAEAQTAGQYHVPIVMTTSNDVDQTGKYFSKYVFQVVPSTHMEPYAMALYTAKKAKKHHWKTLYTISPNYSFGHDTVDTYLAGLKKFNANMKVVGKQWPKLGASDFSQYISAITSKHPDFVFMGQYGGDLVTLTKQADGLGMFKQSQVMGEYWLGALTALGDKAPAGVYASDRTAPFYSVHTKAMKKFVADYHKKYDAWPTLWAILGYNGVQTWVHGVKKAGSFDANKVAEAIAGAKIKSITGSFKIRKCDHLAEVPEYVGILSKKMDSKYGIRKLTHIFKASPKKIMLSCDKKKAMHQGS